MHKENETVSPDTNEKKVIHCYRCNKKCSLLDKHECDDIAFYIWPDNNLFLVNGLLPYLFKIKQETITQPIVIIDFNHKNIPLFLSANWLKQFENTRLILVSDKKTEAIANYWFYNDTNETIISAIIYQDDHDELIESKITNAFLGKTVRPADKSIRLSKNEYELFLALYLGEKPKKIALSKNSNINSIYTMKARIEKKIGTSISRISI